MRKETAFYLLGFLFVCLMALGCGRTDGASPESGGSSAAGDSDKGSSEPVTVGYQGMLNPWKAKIKSGAFIQATGREIVWRKFNSGSEVITALASGDVQLAVAGSSPIATAVSRGVDVSLIWILEAIRENEALVVHKGSGITEVSGLAGKTVGVPFASTTHYHMLIALEQAGLTTKEVKLLNLQPDAMLAAWSQKRIDAAFVWSPTLNTLKQSGEVILTSGQLADQGRPTFDGLVVANGFAKANAPFLSDFVRVIADIDADYRTHTGAWTVDSDKVKAIASLTGAKPEEIPGVLAQYHFPSLEEQASATWLGGGAAKALLDTSRFL
ncbi:MAG: taurine ABC transporter substrate-binding protein, partial [Myxococcota bacterium]